AAARTITPDENAAAHARPDISVFPLAFPLIAGPGTLATILLAFAGVRAGSAQFFAQLGGVALVLALTLGLMLLTGPVMRVIGATGGAVLSRLLGVLLAALAVQFVMDGIREALGAQDHTLRDVRSRTSWPSRWPRSSNRVGGRLAGRADQAPSADSFRNDGQRSSVS